MFALVDCNNFYVSCERVFNPKLRDLPVLILSNNDGCVIARSNEVRALGIKMGQPYFEIKNFCKQKNVQIFSSNFALYGDMSRRVMSVIEESCPDVEIYSIDEAFLKLDGFSTPQIQDFAINLHKKILRYTGIPVSIGVGSTKTQAKLANYIAKREIKQVFFNIASNTDWYKLLPVEEVWGVGRKFSDSLLRLGIKTVYDLSIADPFVMRKKFSLMLMRTILELNGTACLSLEDVTSQKSIISSRSFATLQTDFASVYEALASFCGIASQKLRSQGLVAGRIGVFLRTNMHRKDLKQRSVSQDVQLINPSSDVRIITYWAKKYLDKIFKSGYGYKKVGVYLEKLSDKSIVQMDLFTHESEEQRLLTDSLMRVLDNINNKYGSGTLKTAAEGLQRPWSNRSFCSPCYTTSWLDLPRVII